VVEVDVLDSYRSGHARGLLLHKQLYVSIHVAFLQGLAHILTRLGQTEREHEATCREVHVNFATPYHTVNAH